MQPSIVWAQRKDGKVLITVAVHDAVEPVVKLTPTAFTFQGFDDTKEHKYDVTLELFEEVVVEESSYLVRPRGIEISLKKKDTTIWWPRLSKNTRKLHYVSVDWNRWVDEDDDEEAKDFGWDNGMNFDEDYSDDADDDPAAPAPEELPTTPVNDAEGAPINPEDID